MKLCHVVYSFYCCNPENACVFDKLFISGPFEVVKETPKFYVVETGGKYPKEHFGEVVMDCPAGVPYLELITEETNEEAIRAKLSEWFLKMSKHMGTKPSEDFPVKRR